MTKNICWEIDFWLEGPKYITIPELTEWDMSRYIFITFLYPVLLKSVFTIPDELFGQSLLQKISLKIFLQESNFSLTHIKLDNDEFAWSIGPATIGHHSF